MLLCGLPLYPNRKTLEDSRISLGDTADDEILSLSVNGTHMGVEQYSTTMDDLSTLVFHQSLNSHESALSNRDFCILSLSKELYEA